MKNPFVRGALGVVAGVLAGSVVVFLVEWLSSRIYPLPPGLDIRNREAMTAYMKDLPAGAMALVLAAWFTGAAVAAWIASHIGRALLPGIVAAGFFLAAGLVNMLSFPHPTWFWIASFILFAAAAMVGTRVARPAVRSASR